MSKKDRKVGNDSNRALSKYLEEIGKFEPLSPDKEIELAQRLRGGDRDALRELTESNLRFVVSVAKDYQGQGLPLMKVIWD